MSFGVRVVSMSVALRFWCGLKKTNETINVITRFQPRLYYDKRIVDGALCLPLKGPAINRLGNVAAAVYYMIYGYVIAVGVCRLKDFPLTASVMLWQQFSICATDIGWDICSHV